MSGTRHSSLQPTHECVQRKSRDVLEIHFIEMNKFIIQWHEEALDP